MASSPHGRNHFYNNKQVTQGVTTHSQYNSEFLDNPFRSLTSTIVFIGLCALVVTSIYILLKKYRQFRNYKSSPSRAISMPNLESARALSGGIDTGQLWTWQAEPELATADLVDMREDTAISGGEVSPTCMLPFEGTESHEDHAADCDLEGGLVGRAFEDGSTQEQYYTPANTVIGKTEVLFSARKQAGEELDQVKRNLRSRMIRPNGVVIGRVGDSGIAQRRRATSNKSM